ncbi:MAG TPA: J domain-containing protein [Flavipsychrobacter sp.]|nr:J domain-containing protein [Flavipsychrobacter sp.]
MKNYYTILSVPSTATTKEIKDAFRALSKKYHPDTNHQINDGGEQMKDLNEAYQVLSDKDTRQEYDKKYQEYLAFEKQKWNYEQAMRLFESRKVYMVTFGFDILNTFFKALVKTQGVISWLRILGHSYLIIVDKNIVAADFNKFISSVVPGKDHFAVEINIENYTGRLPQEAWNWINIFRKPTPVPAGA